MNSIRGIGRKRHLATTAAVVMATAGTALFLAPQAKAATGTGSTQLVTVTPTLNAQLSIVATATSLSGLSTSVNPVVVTDTEMDGLTWTASVQATDCFPATSGVSNAAILPASAIQVDPSASTLVPTTSLSTKPVSASVSPAFTFQAPTLPGTSTAPNLSPAQTLASATPNTGDALSNDGIYNLNAAVSVNASPNGFLGLPSTAYTCQLDYTVVG